MSSTYSTSLNIQLMANGEDSGTWGTITNNNWNLMETAVAGIVTITMANTNYTLTVNNGIPDQARNMVIVANGTTGGTGKQIIAPLVPKFYVVSNQTTDGYSFTIGASTGTQVTIPNGITAQVYCDGSTGFYSAQSGSAGNFLVNGNLSVTGNQVDVGNLTVGGTLTLSSALINPIIQGIRETATISSTPASGSINYYTLSQSVLYYVSNAAGNWQLNFTGNGSTTLNSLLAVGQSTSLTFICAQGTTAYYNNAVYIDGTLQSPYWQGGTAPVAGYPSGLDVYTYAIIKTSATPTYTVLASQTQF